MKSCLPSNKYNRKLLFYLIMVLLPIFVCGVIYVVSICFRALPIYDSLKSNQRGWSGKVHRADADLGFAPLSGAHGEHVFPTGPNIPMQYDAEGFRVPVRNDGDSRPKRPLILTLGCSFTYGDAVYAEDTYSYLVGSSLGGTSVNSGVCSYGLSQMLLLANKLLPKHKPDYLITQYSPWLVDRAISPFAPSYAGKIPNPYFYVKNGLMIQPPVFETIIMDLPIDGYRKRQRSIIDLISFIWKVGLPLFVHDDYNMAIYGMKKSIGLIPKPAVDTQMIISSVYGEMAEIARKNKAKLIIVVLGLDEKPVQVPYDLFPADAIVVNAQEALLARLPVVNRVNFRREYNHWRGNPQVLVDTHPNEKAHKIIAKEIVRSISTRGTGN